MDFRMNSCTTNNSIESLIQSALMASKDPKAIQLANDKTVVVTITYQLSRLNNIDPKLKEGGKFVVSQIISTASLVKNGSNPVAASALIAKKFLLAGKFISDNDISKCSLAVSILAVQGIGVAATTAATGGIGILSGIGLLAQVYDTYNSCKVLM